MSVVEGGELFNNAMELVERLRALLLDYKRPEMAARYIFRGQGNASWGLVPAAFRSGTHLGYESPGFSRISDGVPSQTWEQGNAEFAALIEFLQLADKVGLDIPADHKWIRRNPFRNVVGGGNIGSADWPPQDLYEALALAQHHGVPTRLLDFTYDPLIAAFFAGKDVPGDSKHVAVWCLDLQNINLAATNVTQPIELVTVSRAQNNYLAAQKALFVLDRCATTGRGIVDRLQDHVKAGEGRQDLPAGSRAVMKFCLPVDECGNLLDLLGRLGVDRAHLMPSFDGVVKELESRRSRLRAVADAC